MLSRSIEKVVFGIILSLIAIVLMANLVQAERCCQDPYLQTLVFEVDGGMTCMALIINDSEFPAVQGISCDWDEYGVEKNWD
ncbi:hypothetical protein KAR91_10145 [Candidatus Pacearchaeota archaeon]|nr:hypothetical protein [Candidatus Pacearchaeota archaeon]